MKLFCTLVFAAISSLFAQAPSTPVVTPRGVVNAITLQPALSVAAPGAPVAITGLNLSSDAQVLIGNAPATVLSFDAGRIVAQVPLDAKPGITTVVVQRGNASSRPAFIRIAAVAPSIRTGNGLGYGSAGALNGQKLALQVAGLADTVRAYIGGVPANATATPSSDRPGESDVQIDLPPSARSGDSIALFSGPSAANEVVFQNLTAPDVQYAPLPDGAPEIRTITTSALKGNYLVAAGARDAGGCMPGLLFDFDRQKTSAFDCLASQPVAAPQGNALAALAGPPQGQAPAGVSTGLLVMNPANDAPSRMDLPSAASFVSGLESNFTAVLPGDPARTVIVNPDSGDISDAPQAGGAAQFQQSFQQSVDLGNGLSTVLAANRFPPGSAVVVSDSAFSSAKLALLNNKGEVTSTRDFPDGWLPFVLARSPQQQNARPRGAAAFSTVDRTLYVLARSGDGNKHALVAFDQNNTTVIPFPDGWFAPGCAANIPMTALTLSSALVMEGSLTLAKEFQQVCGADGFLLLDLGTHTVSALPVPGQGQIAAGGLNQVNDYLYAASLDASRRGSSDSLFVLDGATQSVFRLNLPAGVAGFSATAPLSAMNGVVALATNRLPGDAGLVIFDLDAGQARLSPVPDGFQTISLLGGGGAGFGGAGALGGGAVPNVTGSAEGFFPATRKFAVRGNRSSGSQMILFDVITGNTQAVPNPDGVAYVGTAASAGAPAGGGAGTPAAGPVIRANARANSIAALGFNSDRKPVGIVVVRVP